MISDSSTFMNGPRCDEAGARLASFMVAVKVQHGIYGTYLPTESGRGKRTATLLRPTTNQNGSAAADLPRATVTFTCSEI